MDDINSILSDIKKSAFDNLFSMDYDAAISELKKGEMLDRGNPEILFNLGIAYCRKGLFNTALDYFLKVLDLKTSFIDKASVIKNIAFVLINKREYDSALNHLNSILADYRSDVHALNMKGYCLEKKGDLKEALKIYREILLHDKSNVNSLNSTSYLMAVLGIELESSLKIAQFIYNKNSDNPAYADTLGYIHLKLGNYSEAEKYLKKAASIVPFDPEISQHLKELNNLTK